MCCKIRCNGESEKFYNIFWELYWTKAWVFQIGFGMQIVCHLYKIFAAAEKNIYNGAYFILGHFSDIYIYIYSFFNIDLA
jgi:hypothetical protein